MLTRSGVRKATGSYRTYSSLVKLQPRFLSLQWKTCLWAENAVVVPEFAVKNLPLGKTLMMMIFHTVFVDHTVYVNLSKMTF